MRSMWASLLLLPMACSDSNDAAPPAPLADAGGDATPVADASRCDNDRDGDGLFKHLDCSGLYASFGDKTIASDVKAYKPGVEFWSDGAEKQRWIYLPPGQKIDISNFDEWTFPVGTKVWKEFKLRGKRIETRLFTKIRDSAWAHATYRWSDDESDAVRKTDGESIPGLGPDGSAYEIPTSGQCDMCHGGRKDSLLGFEAVSLGLESATGETLAALATDGLLSATPPKTSLAFPETDAGKAREAIGWMHANCGACHNENETAAASFRAHFRVRATDLAPTDGGAPRSVDELDVYTQAYCKDTYRSEPDGGPVYKYIRGGSPARSLTSVLAHGRARPDQTPNAGVQMPPIVTRAPDQVGVAKLDAWISSLPPCK